MIPPRDYVKLIRRTPSTICAVLIEGIGDVAFRGRTALEAADCPCLDKLASESECGLLVPLGRGVSPGPGTALLAFLGYDPAEFPLPDEMAKLLAGERESAPDLPVLPSMSERYRLAPAAITATPVARCVAAMVGMDLLDAGETVAEHFQALQKAYDHHDFFFVHVPLPKAETPEERFRAKVATVEAVDHSLPGLLALEPDVIVIAGESSIPAALGRPSWHPAPFLLWSRHCRLNRVERFTELECAVGVLGRLPALDAMPLMLANALKLAPLGA